MSIKSPLFHNSNNVWLRLGDLTERYSCSPSTVWRWSKSRATFPKPVRLGPNTIAWSLSAIEEFEASQKEDSSR
ncbi:AlpA family phage regulatory protein [uncultured Phyllobacterium sp.]|uniref:helix-turn-helix transcriptional regulator n=1 Tax=uncultured Phyllobacterium sp. TaxID=253813 RepID=UPI00338EC136